MTSLLCMFLGHVEQTEHYEFDVLAGAYGIFRCKRCGLRQSFLALRGEEMVLSKWGKAERPVAESAPAPDREIAEKTAEYKIQNDMD